VRYFVISRDSGRRETVEGRLAEHGFDVIGEYDTDAVIVTVGGDGTVLHAARTYPEPTILPVRAGESKGYRTHLETDELVDALDCLEAGAYSVDEHPTLGASRAGTELAGGFDALNEVSLHHTEPTLAAVFSVRVRDGPATREFEELTGDGVLVATPFGSTGYYRSVTDGTFATGLGLAFNNVHTPTDVPTYLGLSADAVVELELLESDTASGAVLTWDNADGAYDLAVGEPIEIRRSDATVEILNPESV